MSYQYSSKLYRKLHPECRPGVWIIQKPERCRVFVTQRSDEKSEAILLDDFGDQRAFSLFDLSRELKADYLGTAIVVGDDRGKRHDNEAPGCMLIRNDECYLTCIKEGKPSVFQIDENDCNHLPRDGNHGFNWRVLWWFDEGYSAVIYECPDGEPGLIA